MGRARGVVIGHTSGNPWISRRNDHPCAVGENAIRWDAMGSNGGAAPTRHQDSTDVVEAPVERHIELLGDLDRSLDDRGRLSMPTSFRWAYADGAVILPWPGPCIALLTLEEYRKMEEAMRVKQRDSLGDTRARRIRSSTPAADSSSRRPCVPTPASPRSWWSSANGPGSSSGCDPLARSTRTNAGRHSSRTSTRRRCDRCRRSPSPRTVRSP